MMTEIERKAAAWDEIQTHLHVYYDLMKEKLKNSPPKTEDTDEGGYWQHELNALYKAEVFSCIGPE